MEQSVKTEQQMPIDGQVQRLQSLLVLEAQLRRQKSPMALSLWAVNELAGVVDYSQGILFRMNRTGRLRAVAVSNLASIDRNAPFVRWIEEQVGQALQAHSSDDADTESDVVHVSLTGQITGAQSKTNAARVEREDERGWVYPFQQAVFLPLYNREHEMFGGLLVARSQPWLSAELVILTRVAETISHAFQTLLPQKRLRLWSLPKWLMAGLGVLVIGTMFISVPLTTLAPVEIIADKPVIVTAPIDGVVARIFKDANVEVNKGEVLFEFDNTELKAAADIARRKELVARARQATAKQAAFNDAEVYRQLAIVKSEVALAEAERNFADQKLARTIVRAQRSGKLIYTDRKDWIGKPVKTGERVMEIADIRQVALRIDLPVADAIGLVNGAETRVFLDANPLKALSAKVRHASYHALERPGVGLVYQVIADLVVHQGGDKQKAEIMPRIGLRGTAQIFGEKVFLGFYLFRKPVSTLRQYFGF